MNHDRPEKLNFLDHDGGKQEKDLFLPSEEDIKNRRLDTRLFSNPPFVLEFVTDDSMLTITNDKGEKWEFPYETNKIFELDDDKRYVMLIEEKGYARLLASAFLAEKESARFSYPGLIPQFFGFVNAFDPDCIFEDRDGVVYTATVRKVGVIGAIVAVVAVVYIAVFVMTGDTTVRDKTADTPRGDPVELALEAFRKDDYQHGYQYAMSTDKTHPKLQCYIGMCYDQQEPRSRGMLITKDDWTARTWYEKSAAQGDARAMTYLGVFCENGRGGDVDCAKAIDWYRKASQKNYPEGKANLDRLAKKLKKAKDEEEERTRMQKKKEEDERKKKENDAHLEKQRQRGYTIEGYGGERRAVWHAGTTLAQYPHWITTAKENTWRIEDGYEKVDPSAPALSPVAWKPGIFKSHDVKSGEKEGTWLHKIICPTCSGSKSIAYYADCDMCGGRGRVSTSRDCARCNGRGLVQMQSTCASCNGSGRSVGQCGTCSGSGRRMCSNCGGRGQIVNPVAVGVGIANIFGAAKGRGGIPTGPSTITCMSCGGRGYMACSGCGGAGTVTSNCRACSGRGRTLSNTTCQFCGGSRKTALSGDCPNCTNGKVKKSRQCQSCKGKGAIWK